MTIQKRTMAELQAAFAKKATDDNDNGGAHWKKFFPFWKADFDTTSRVRFLPDLDAANPTGFLVTNITHQLEVNGRKETVACGAMYGKPCPICEASRKFYADAKAAGETKDRPGPLTAMGKKFYRKLSYIGQVLVMDTTVEHDQTQLVKLIDFGPKIYQKIQAAFQSGDLVNPPYEFKGGHDFRINKIKNGDWGDYGNSTFAPRESDVADDLIEQIELFDLAQYRQPYVTPEVLQGMVDSVLAGGTSSPASARTAAAPTGFEDDAPVAAADESAAKPAKVNVAEQIRAKQAAKRAAEAAAAGE